MKGYLTFHQAPWLNLHHQIQFSVLFRTLIWRGYYLLTEIQSVYSIAATDYTIRITVNQGVMAIKQCTPWKFGIAWFCIVVFLFINAIMISGKNFQFKKKGSLDKSEKGWCCLRAFGFIGNTSYSGSIEIGSFFFFRTIAPQHSHHHHHHVVPLERIYLTLSRHFSLSFIASGRS